MIGGCVFYLRLEGLSRNPPISITVIPGSLGDCKAFAKKRVAAKEVVTEGKSNETVELWVDGVVSEN